MGGKGEIGNVLARSALFGVVAGLRSQTPSALLALRWESAPRGAGWRTWPVLRAKWGRVALIAAGAGEMFIGDKHPRAPARIQPGPLGGRIAFGALAGAALASDGGRARLVRGGAAGALGALAGSFGGHEARRHLGALSGLPDPVIALSEDALAIGLGLLALRAGE